MRESPRYLSKKLDALRFSITLYSRGALSEYRRELYNGFKTCLGRCLRIGQLLDECPTSMNLDKLVGSGPFIVREFERDRRVLLRRNEHYWRVDTRGNRLPYLDEAEFLISSDLSVSLSRFEDGDTLHDVRASERLKDAEKASKFRDGPRPVFNNYLMLNLDPGRDESGTPFVDPVKLRWFKQPEFRAAISHAIDRNGIVRQILGGRGEPHGSYYSSESALVPSEREETEFDHRLRQSVSTKSVSKRAVILWWTNAGRSSKFAIIMAENDMRVAMMNLVRRDLRKLGMAVEIQPMPFNDIVQALRVNQKIQKL